MHQSRELKKNTSINLNLQLVLEFSARHCQSVRPIAEFRSLDAESGNAGL